MGCYSPSPERQTSAVLLLIDDAAGRAEAERRNIPTTGTLGIIRPLRSADLRIYRRPWAAFGRQISVARRYFSINCWLKMHSANTLTDQRVLWREGLIAKDSSNGNPSLTDGC